MRKLCVPLFVTGLFAFTGCSTSDTGGIPSGTKTEFKLSGPATVTLKQGETKAVKVKVERGKNFKEDVKLEAPSAPTGISVEPVDVKASQSEEADVRIKVAMDAPVGEHRVTIVGKPVKGEPASHEVKIKVEAAKEATKEGAKKEGEKDGK